LVFGRNQFEQVQHIKGVIRIKKKYKKKVLIYEYLRKNAYIRNKNCNTDWLVAKTNIRKYA